MTDDVLSLTDDEDDNGEFDETLPSLAGTLSKWTNYIHGWQDRYIVIKNGTISYYKSEQEAAVGCRGAVSLLKAVISAHEFDDCRFDVGINDCMWYLRANSSQERYHWMNVLEMHKRAEQGDESSLRRHGSKLSLASTASLSTASTSSFKRGRGLKEKLAEMETFKEILCHQVDSLQNYFDACASAITQCSVHDVESDDINDVAGEMISCPPPLRNGLVSHHIEHGKTRDSVEDVMNVLQQHGAHAIDFKGEAFTFKATTAGILATLSHCIELMGQREEAWKKRLDRETEKRKKLSDAYRHLLVERPKQILLGGPDYEEGPHSMLNDEEFFDAVDATLDKLEKEDVKKSQMEKTFVAVDKTAKPPKTSLDPTHPLYDEIRSVVDEHIRTADMTASDVASTWTLVASEGDMKVYKREVEENGAVVYPLKAVHSVKNITGHELCHYFWDPAVRMEWEATLDTTVIADWLSKDTNITYQVVKRVWPAAQRDSFFWSTIRHCPSDDDDGPDYWIVVNHSTDESHAKPPPNQPKCIRLQFNVAMICQTVVQPPVNGKPVSRENLTCRIQYSANVNPGGWVPASVIQIICKREAPKFLKNFTSYVQEKTKDLPIMF